MFICYNFCRIRIRDVKHPLNLFRKDYSMFKQLLKNSSIKQRINYLLGIVGVSVVGASLFAFYTLHSIGSQYNDLQDHSTAGAMDTLHIQKDLNYISRTTRDILLGGDYDKDMQKLKERTENIRQFF